MNLLGPDVSSLGYRQQEFFLQGTAAAFKPAGTLGADGKWRVKQSGAAPFKTRMVVCQVTFA